MTTFTESIHPAEYISSEANGTRAREVVTVAPSDALLPGTVLGIVTASGKYAAHDPDASDGTEVAAAVLYDHLAASGSDQQAVVTARDSEVVGSLLTWKTGISANDKAAGLVALKALGIIAR